MFGKQEKPRMFGFNEDTLTLVLFYSARRRVRHSGVVDGSDIRQSFLALARNLDV